MIATSKHTISAAVRSTTLSVMITGARRARVRIWLGAHVNRVAAAIIGCGVEVSIKVED